MSRPLQLQEPQSFASLSVPRRGRRSPNCGVGRLDSAQRPEGRCRPANSAAVHRLVDCLGKISRSVDDAGVRQDAIHLILLSSQSRINQMGDEAALARPSFARCCSDPFVESSWNGDVLSHVSCHSPMIHTLARALHTAHACQPIFDRHRLFGTRGRGSRLPLHLSLIEGHQTTMAATLGRFSPRQDVAAHGRRDGRPSTVLPCEPYSGYGSGANAMISSPCLAAA